MQDMTVVTEATLFEKIGGQQAIQAVVEEFYNRVLADSDLNGFFADVNHGAAETAARPGS